MAEELLRLGLHDLHVELGGRMVPFAGYEMPVQYPMGVLKEHLHCRAQAGGIGVGIGVGALPSPGGGGFCCWRWASARRRASRM